ncbi:MAG: cystathionine beta-lyase, partial [Psychroflexus sp.]
MKHNPANAIQDVHYTDAHGGINPAISDSSTYTFKKAQDMADTFAGEKLDAFLYSRHSSPS